MKAIILTVLAAFGVSYYLYTNEVKNEEREDKARVQWSIQKELDHGGHYVKGERGQLVRVHSIVTLTK